MTRFCGALTVAAAVLLLAPDARATVTFSGASGGLAASAAFTLSGTTLTVLLTNTDTAPAGSAWVPAEMLTGLFFNLGNSEFGKVSATIPAGDAIIQTNKCDTPCAGATDVGGEWGYAFYPADAAPPLPGANQGISSSGYIGGASTLFGGTNYDGPAVPNGIDFGIAPAVFNAGDGNGGLDKVPLIRDTVSFVLTVPDGLSEASIGSVYFTYGTSLGEGTVPGSPPTGPVPEPSVLALMVGGGAAIAYRLRRRRAS